MTNRPNKQALTEALDIFRDAMRHFIIRNLKKVQGRKPVDIVKAGLNGDRRETFLRDMEAGRSLEEAIDVGDFRTIVRNSWTEVFRSSIGGSGRPTDILQAIAGARIQVAHPVAHDIDYNFTLDRLEDIIQILSDINYPGDSESVTNIKDRLAPFTTPAHRFHQGGRDVYAFTLDLETLDKILPERVEERLVVPPNRPLTESHANDVQTYLQRRGDWLLGPVLLGIRDSAINFESFMDDASSTAQPGLLTISNDGVGALQMFDGQHRRRAIKGALSELSHSQRTAGKLAALRKDSLPVLLYVEGNVDALKQMFFDASQTKPIERNTVAQFDQRDAFNRVAIRLTTESDLFGGRVEMERPSVSANSQKIIAINQLALTLKTLAVGLGGRVRQEKNDEHMVNLDALYDTCVVWADSFMPAARQEYADLISGSIEVGDIPTHRHSSMAFNATVIRMLAGIYHIWTRGDTDWKELADFLRNESLEPRRPDNLLVEAGIVAPNGTSPASRLSDVRRAVVFVTDKVRAHLQADNQVSGEVNDSTHIV